LTKSTHTHTRTHTHTHRSSKHKVRRLANMYEDAVPTDVAFAILDFILSAGKWSKSMVGLFAGSAIPDHAVLIRSEFT
jgi:hypothetical protein